MRKSAIVFCCLVLLGGAVAFGQGTTGSIRVNVVDDDGKVLPGARVSAESPDALGTRASVADASGLAVLSGLIPSNTYLVTISLSGFNTARYENVLVKSGSVAELNVSMSVAAMEAEIIVTAESPLVDFSSAMTGADLTLELMESLPTGRSYQDYLQLVPGVMPTDPTVVEQNPASRSGVNYTDIGGNIGRSSDNFYYIAGINVTDPNNGLTGADLNVEIIQEQSVVTGGIPSEFAGAPGLVSSVITKSGGNDFHGSVNYFFQNDSLMQDNQHVETSAFSAYDAAFTLGGPILRDKVWFFASYRWLDRSQDVSATDTGEYMRTVNTDQTQGFAKLTWSPASAIKITGTYMTDPRTVDGQVLQSTSNTFNRSEETGGDRYIANYSHVLGPAYLSISGGVHQGELSRYAAIQEIRTDLYFWGEDDFTADDEQLGGYGQNVLDTRDNNFVDGSLEWYLGSSWGDHTLAVGVEYMDHERMRDLTYPGDYQYGSYDRQYSGVSAYDLSSSDLWTGSDWGPDNTSDYTGTIAAINASPNRDQHYATMDTNGDGTITQEEMAAGMIFDSTEGNPENQLNYYRIFMRIPAPLTTNVKGWSGYLQDTWQIKRFTANVGFRYEDWTHYASDGSQISDFDSTIAPRVGLVYDITGKGKMKISGFYGRYYDPIRMNMTNFAGSLTGSVRDEQIWTNFEWLTYRTRGGVQTQDALFSPTTKTTYTDDIQIGFEMDLGNNMSFEAIAIRRQTRNIMEDYDLCLYAYCTDGTTTYDDPDAPNSLWLGLDYFGYDENPGSNFVIGTLAGGERNWDGFELVFRKRYSNNWQGLFSYTYADATGNSNSDSNADFQGDFIWVDPYAPNQFGRQPGMIEHLAKFGGSYSFNFGLEVGGGIRYSSGTAASRTFQIYGRNLPVRVDEAYEYGGMTARWLAPGNTGVLTNDSWWNMDLRFKYSHAFGWLSTELFLDVFNIFDDQAAVRNQDVVAGSGGVPFGDALQWMSPRRAYLGIRLGF
jgi:hypothetical protein